MLKDKIECLHIVYHFFASKNYFESKYDKLVNLVFFLTLFSLRSLFGLSLTPPFFFIEIEGLKPRAPI